MNPAEWQTLLQSGMEAFHGQRSAESVETLRKAYRLAPHERDVRYWLGNALRSSGESTESEQVFRKLLAEKPADTETAFALAFLLREEARTDQAAHVLLKLIRYEHKETDTLLKVAGFLRDSNQFEAAISALEMALLIAPDDAGLYFKLARLLQAVGKFDQALDNLRHALDLNPRLGGAWLSLAQLQHFDDKQSEDWQRIDQAAQRSRRREQGSETRYSLGPEADMCLAFCRGKALDDLEEWRLAWKEFVHGNRLRKATQAWSKTAWNEFVSTQCQFNRQPAPLPLNSKRHPVFIIGMLRSGTTLLEQLLDRHAQITGRGELNFLSHLASNQANIGPHILADGTQGNELWAQMRQQGPEHHHYIDKNPLNFRFLGLLLDVFPEAKIIHVRRDGRDSCLSCFTQLFQHPDAGFSNSLEDLSDYYRGYRKIMRHWNALAGERIHTLSYEDLVTTTQITLESVSVFLGLESKVEPQDPARPDRLIRTASTWQARQTLHKRSISRWKNYYHMAPGFFDSVAEIDERQ